MVNQGTVKGSGTRQRGFTLIEIALVLLVVTIIAGYGIALYPRQQELRQYRAADAQMEDIVERLIAFAQVNGRLPCPDTANAVLDGQEDRAGLNSCAAFFGFLPGRTLGFEGGYGTNGVLLDPWGSGYGYAVSDIEVPALSGNRVLVTTDGVRNVGMAAVVPDLYLCDGNDNPAPDLNADCTSTAGGSEVMGSNGEVAAVIVSLGRDNEIPATSNIQAENLDDFDDGTNDKVYIVARRNEFEGSITQISTYYDDIVKWVPTNLLFSRMIAAGQLP